MSTIFTTETQIIVARPRADATIRVEELVRVEGQTSPLRSDKKTWRSVQLLEFHPDFDYRYKFRGFAYIAPQPDLWYPLCGVGFLEKPYMEVNEVFIHEDDRREMMEYCRTETASHKQYTPLVIWPCPLPFPMFEVDDRVVVVKTDEEYGGQKMLGALATVTEASSMGNMTTVRFDMEELNRGFKAVSFISANLRKVEDTQPGGAYYDMISAMHTAEYGIEGKTAKEKEE